MELEERTIDELPERCENCGATLTREEKQRILEERTEHGRLMVIVELLARGLENLAMAARIHSRAQTNGKVAPPKESEEPPSE